MDFTGPALINRPSLLASRVRCFAAQIFTGGFFAVDFTATTTVSFPDTLPDLSYFVAHNEANSIGRLFRQPRRKFMSIQQTVMFACARLRIANISARSRAIGSFHLVFIHSCSGWRRRCRGCVAGKVCATPRVGCDAGRMAERRLHRVSRDLVLAVEQLRAQRDLPRYVYIRPTEQALRRSGAEGRDKDTKPVFCRSRELPVSGDFSSLVDQIRRAGSNGDAP